MPRRSEVGKSKCLGEDGDIAELEKEDGFIPRCRVYPYRGARNYRISNIFEKFILVLIISPIDRHGNPVLKDGVIDFNLNL